jgi:hypothetical protein
MTRSPSPNDHDTATFADELDQLRRVYRRFRHFYERMNKAFSYQLAANYVFDCIVAMSSCYSAINVTFNSGNLAISLSDLFHDLGCIREEEKRKSASRFKVKSPKLRRKVQMKFSSSCGHECYCHK